MVARLITLFLLQIAREHGIRFFETSAKANINIEKAFLTLAEDILKKVGARWGQGLPAIWFATFTQPFCYYALFDIPSGLTRMISRFWCEGSPSELDLTFMSSVVPLKWSSVVPIRGSRRLPSFQSSN